jgi:hypothetical protein
MNTSGIIGFMIEMIIMISRLPPAIDDMLTENYYMLYEEDITDGMVWLFN